MASVTAEVMLDFGLDMNRNRDIVDLIDTLRLDAGVDNGQAIIDLLQPLYDLAYDRGADSERAADW